MIIIICSFIKLLTYRAINNTNIRHAGRDTTAATQGSTIYRRVKPAKLLPHTAHSDWINRTGLTSWAFTRWCDRHTSDKVAHYSIYRPRKDEMLSWPWVAGYRDKVPPRQDKGTSISLALDDHVKTLIWCHSATGFVFWLTCYWINITMQSACLFVTLAA